MEIILKIIPKEKRGCALKFAAEQKPVKLHDQAFGALHFRLFLQKSKGRNESPAFITGTQISSRYTCYARTKTAPM